MIILDKPYISEFLLNTLESNEIPVIYNKVAAEFAPAKKFNFISETEVVKLFNGEDYPLLYTNSENAISWIETNLHHTTLPGKIQLFKNKVLEVCA